MCLDQFSVCHCLNIVLTLSIFFFFFHPLESGIPPSDLDNDIQAMVTIPLAGPDLVS